VSIRVKILQHNILDANIFFSKTMNANQKCSNIFEGPIGSDIASGSTGIFTPNNNLTVYVKRTN